MDLMARCPLVVTHRGHWQFRRNQAAWKVLGGRPGPQSALISLPPGEMVIFAPSEWARTEK